MSPMKTYGIAGFPKSGWQKVILSENRWKGKCFAFGQKQVFKDMKVKEKKGTITAFIIYVITVLLLFYITNFRFGGAVQTGLVWIAAIPPVYGFFYTKEKRAQEKLTAEGAEIPELKIFSIISAIVIMLWTVSWARNMITNPHDMKGYFAIPFLCSVGIYAAGKKYLRFFMAVKLSFLVSLCYAGIILTAGIYLILTDVSTVEETKSDLQNQGYYKVIYTGAMGAGNLEKIGIYPSTSSEEKDACKYYLFTGEKEGGTYGLVTDIWDGTIEAQLDLSLGCSPEQALAFYEAYPFQKY